jgi:branched-chain amino acid aminotransferase
VDDRVFSNGAPGPVAGRLRVLYFEWMARPAMRQEVAYAA